MSGVFDADSGTYQGRIRPTNWTPVNGEYAFCLGHDLTDQVYEIEETDFVELAQTFDATGFDIVQFALHIRAPTSMPQDVTWSIIISTSVTDYFEIMLPVGTRERTLDDMVMPTVVNPATTTVRVTLALLAGAGSYDVELPGVYLDAFVSAVPGQNPLVACRDPRVDDVNVNDDTEIFFNVFGIADALTGVTIRVDGSIVGVLDGVGAVNAVTTAVGWTVYALAADSTTTRYRLTRATPFASEAVVVVEVEASTAVNTTTTTWSFTIADTEGPRLLTAEATALLEVTLTWNEQLPDSALDPALYTLSLESDPPAFVPTVLDVRREDAERVVLVLDQPATTGATYLVTAAGVVDMFGNAVEAPYDTATWTTYVPSLAPENRLLSLYQELPEAERDTDVSSELRLFCNILDEGLRAITAVVDEWPLIVVDPDTATEPFLDAILWELGDPFSWMNLPVAKKRVLARVMHALVALKGGGPGIVAAIRLLLGIEVQIHVYGWGPAGLGEAIMGETFILGSDDEDDLYTFWVIVPEPLDADTENAMDQILKIMKVAHERHLIVQPEEVFVPDHWALGFSELGVETTLHAS